MKPLDLLSWQPPLARRSDPETSFEAANDASFRASNGRMLVLKHLAVLPMTDFELATATGTQQTSIGKRRGECMNNGLVRVSLDHRGDVVKRKTPSGSLARVWELTEDGKTYLREAANVRD